MRTPVDAFVALGGNLGDARAAVLAAMDAIGGIRETRVTARSSLYRSAPVDAAGPDFVNAVVRVETSLCAPDLLEELQRIESAAGRERPYRHAPRTLDLDVLLYGGARIDSARLTVPHPRMRQRAFVLLPLHEIAPELVPPGELAAMTSQVIARIP